MAPSVYTFFILQLLLLDALQLTRIGADVPFRHPHSHYQKTKNANMRSDDEKGGEKEHDPALVKSEPQENFQDL